MFKFQGFSSFKLYINHVMKDWIISNNLLIQNSTWVQEHGESGI